MVRKDPGGRLPDGYDPKGNFDYQIKVTDYHTNAKNRGNDDTNANSNGENRMDNNKKK